MSLPDFPLKTFSANAVLFAKAFCFIYGEPVTIGNAGWRLFRTVQYYGNREEASVAIFFFLSTAIITITFDHSSSSSWSTGFPLGYFCRKEEQWGATSHHFPRPVVNWLNLRWFSSNWQKGLRKYNRAKNRAWNHLEKVATSHKKSVFISQSLCLWLMVTLKIKKASRFGPWT